MVELHLFMCASISRKPRSPFWMAKFRDHDGRVVMRSTKKKLRGEAIVVALAWENAARKARAGELTQAASVKILSELMEATLGESLKSHTIEQCLQNFLKNLTGLGRSQSTVKRYEPIIGSFLSSIGPLRKKASIRSLTVTEIEHWRDAETASGKSAKTVNMGIRTLATAIAGCKRRGEILTNPAEAVTLVAGNSEERDPFTLAEISALLRVAKDDYVDWKTAILTGALAGLRLGDVTSLLWGQVDLVAGCLNVTPDKTENAVTIALAPQLREHLESLPVGGPDVPLMPSLSGRKTGSNGENAGLSNEFRRLMKKADIVTKSGKKKTGKGRQMSKKTFHSLRHTFTTSLAESGAADAVTKSMTGHTTDEAFRRYIHLGLDAQRKALSALPKIEV